MSLTSILPAPIKKYEQKASSTFDSDTKPTQGRSNKPHVAIPPYGSRSGWRPKSDAEFNDGGAFPEIHVRQYPLGMGRSNNNRQSNALALKLNSQGSIQYDSVIRASNGSNEIIHSHPTALQEKHLSADDLSRPSAQDEEDTQEATKNILDAIVLNKVNANKASHLAPEVRHENAASTYYSYTPSATKSGFTLPENQVQHRIVRVTEKPKDPLDPHKFKNPKAPAPSDSTLVPILHDVEHKLTPEEKQIIHVPPCVSGWKNSTGRTIGLEHRNLAHGGHLIERQISSKFADVVDALEIAREQKAKEIKIQIDIDNKRILEERLKKQEKLRNLSSEINQQKARMDEEERRKKSR